MERSINDFGDDDDWFYSRFRLFDDFTDTSHCRRQIQVDQRLGLQQMRHQQLRGVLNSKCLVNLRLNKI